MKKTICALAAFATLSAAPYALAHKQGDILVRAGAATVVPNESSDDVLGLGEFGVSSNTQLGLTVGYMLTDNISIELLAATPFKHDVSLGNGVGDIAEVEHLPPTLMIQYYFLDSTSKFRPYVGAGLNYTTFFNEDFNGKGKGLGLSDLKLDDSWGLAANVGIDYQLKDNWFVGASVWYADINTDVSFKAGNDRVTIDTDIDPWVFMVSAGYTF
ncbi:MULTISPECIES: outer membrane protein OmpW [Photobacterium]|uniref:Outer membrane protein W n=1 Tax=Photobacterium ganghwense TaxID=320778 RepID=A0A0J1HHF6_9GAMM|nr:MULTISPECIES: outer membrane protein OmpW [Photobacterium]KLV11056.1 membrane protein [Photobacterium ganghwense]MBV1840431.1 outer membrane protein OmpW [Photobacterium ganghwense]PSU11321.1 outer membrane protein OmpW [Photobacterium ganghwense]QSV13446.1 outer membrane protein OmpW [Photobacterium ganghwense]